MKKAGMKKGKNKEFSTPYTVTNAVAKGNIITKLSLLIMGLGNIAHKQIGKGIMFLAVEAAYIWYMIQSGIYNLSMLPSLGWREQEKVWNEKKSIYEYTAGDQSSLILLYGVATVDRDGVPQCPPGQNKKKYLRRYTNPTKRNGRVLPNISSAVK